MPKKKKDKDTVPFPVLIALLVVLALGGFFFLRLNAF